jgi:hypothetical protein
MKLPIIKTSRPDDIKEFVTFWKKLYHYPLESLYNDSINKTQFDINDIQNLYIWKNGMALSEKKQLSLNNKIISKLEIINSYKSNSNWTVVDFQKNFKDLTAVWKIFLLHIIKPEFYPIYDQHIHRTYNFINNIQHANISNTISNAEKEKFYFDTYLNFIHSKKGIKLKDIDEAFFSFGQFINTNNYQILVL